MLSMTLGCMYAGKTSALIEDYGLNHGLIIDYDTLRRGGIYHEFIYTHDNRYVSCVKTQSLDIDLEDATHVYINEAQFFSNIKPFVVRALEKKIHVHLYGLDGDFKQEQFGELLSLIPMCDSYIKLYATCACGNKASFSKRISKTTEQYAPHDTYIPCCRTCLF